MGAHKIELTDKEVTMMLSMVKRNLSDETFRMQRGETLGIRVGRLEVLRDKLNAIYQTLD